MFAFEITSLLLTIAVVGAVVLSRRPKGDPIDLERVPDRRASPMTDAETGRSVADGGRHS